MDLASSYSAYQSLMTWRVVTSSLSHNELTTFDILVLDNYINVVCADFTMDNFAERHQLFVFCRRLDMELVVIQEHMADSQPQTAHVLETLTPEAGISARDKQSHPTEYCGMQLLISVWDTSFWYQRPLLCISYSPVRQISLEVLWAALLAFPADLLFDRFQLVTRWHKDV